MSPRLIDPQAEAPLDEVTATVAEPNLVASCVEVAVIVTVSGGVPAGVKVTPVPELTPVDGLSVPSPPGPTERFTVFVNAPVPVTVGLQVDVCVAPIVVGVHKSDTPVIVGAPAATVILAEPETLVKPPCAEWAIQEPVPAPVGVKTPATVMVPPVAVQVTAEV